VPRLGIVWFDVLFPQADAAIERIVPPAPEGVGRERVNLAAVAAAEHHIVSRERGAQERRDLPDGLLPRDRTVCIERRARG